MDRLFRKFESIRALAQSGLNHSQDLPNHHEQYSGILNACLSIAQDVSADAYSAWQWKTMLSELGVITPKVGSVVGVFRDDGCMLVLKRQSEDWCLPCGYADIDETPEDTARREVLEETGLNVSELELLGVKTTKDDHSLAFMWEVVYRAYSCTGNISLSHEHMAAEWISEIDNRNWHSTHRNHAATVFSAYDASQLHENIEK